MKNTEKLTEGQRTIKKYLSDDYARRDTPALIRYEHTKLPKDLLMLLTEYEYDCKFLSLSLMDDVLDKMEEIAEDLNMNYNKDAADMVLIDSLWLSYNVVFKHREDEFNELALEQWDFEEFDELMEELNIETNTSL